jgi:hypothetical protein
MQGRCQTLLHVFASLQQEVTMSISHRPMLSNPFDFTLSGHMTPMELLDAATPFSRGRNKGRY